MTTKADKRWRTMTRTHTGKGDARRPYDKKKYEIDFPEEGTFNWVKIKLKGLGPYFEGVEGVGVLLHDGNFISNGLLFYSNNFDIIDNDPLGLKQTTNEKSNY